MTVSVTKQDEYGWVTPSERYIIIGIRSPSPAPRRERSGPAHRDGRSRRVRADGQRRVLGKPARTLQPGRLAPGRLPHRRNPPGSGERRRPRGSPRGRGHGGRRSACGDARAVDRRPRHASGRESRPARPDRPRPLAGLALAAIDLLASVTGIPFASHDVGAVWTMPATAVLVFLALRRLPAVAPADRLSALAVFALALTLRLALGPWGPLHANGLGALWVTGAARDPEAIATYGPGFAELFAWIAALAPSSPDWAVFAGNAVLSAAVSALAFALGRLAGIAIPAALAAALFLAIDPVSIHMSATESYFPVIIFLCTGAAAVLLAAARAMEAGDRWGAGAGIVAAGLLLVQVARIHPVAWGVVAIVPSVVLAGEVGSLSRRMLVFLASAAIIVGVLVALTGGGLLDVFGRVRIGTLMRPPAPPSLWPLVWAAAAAAGLCGAGAAALARRRRRPLDRSPAHEPAYLLAELDLAAVLRSPLPDAADHRRGLSAAGTRGGSRCGTERCRPHCCGGARSLRSWRCSSPRHGSVSVCPSLPRAPPTSSSTAGCADRSRSFRLNAASFTSPRPASAPSSSRRTSVLDRDRRWRWTRAAIHDRSGSVSDAMPVLRAHISVLERRWPAGVRRARKPPGPHSRCPRVVSSSTQSRRLSIRQRRGRNAARPRAGASPAGPSRTCSPSATWSCSAFT